MFVAAALFGLLGTATIVGPYGYFIDEFYYTACARHLAWGYVDHPPLSIFVPSAVRAFFGESLLAIRLPAAIAAAATAISPFAAVGESQGRTAANQPFLPRADDGPRQSL